MSVAGKFYYFGFGSNLLRERLQLLNPSAKFQNIARLKDHKLTFHYSNEPTDRSVLGWRGCPATIVPCEGSDVWGVVWELSNKDLKNLDSQEGVESGTYKPIEVTVQTSLNETYVCRSYQLLLNGNGDNRPSPQYLDIIMRGARQNMLPEDYISFLANIEHNGYNGPCSIYDEVLKSINN